MQETEFQLQLKKFSRILKQEKQYLIKDKAEELILLVAKKEKFVPVLQEYQGEISPATRQLLVQIKAQQEENTLLTKQAIGYQKMLMTAVKANLKSPAGTYSKNAKVADSQRTAMIDREV
ncbi:hypothetical protein [Liquorilactobacillus oeni]|uniref:Flagella synthesis protein FlgN n=2 Tax=Liquorilactobacillus oeni TaxID=303241 RepID=A0A0R1MJW2_9LACO|nr:hypothetical protein [Liquorilactobacillus oeni]AJA34176.1 flagella synthesis protein FlgN [Liquorilactobacillus oeni]KRL05482.1 hypothetical protein FD46_GL000899 [Liquorilactobacillus oeni DSM 19972]